MVFGSNLFTLIPILIYKRTKYREMIDRALNRLKGSNKKVNRELFAVIR